MFSLNLAYEEKLETLQKEFRISVTKEIIEKMSKVLKIDTDLLRQWLAERAEAQVKP